MTVDDANPYEAPRVVEARGLRERAHGGRPAGRRLVGWMAVFVANLPVPLLLGSSMTDPDGKVGMAAGVGMMGVLGGIGCWRWRRLGMALIVGGAVVGFLQFMPLPQVVAGAAGMEAGERLGVVDASEDGIGKAVGLAGGALVTIVTGSLLMAAAATVGLVLQVVTPGRWWGAGPGSGTLG